MSPDEVERLSACIHVDIHAYIDVCTRIYRRIYIEICTYTYVGVHRNVRVGMRALMCARVHDMILRPRIPHLGRRDWSDSHVRSNPRPIALFPSAVSGSARTCICAMTKTLCSPRRHGDLYTAVQREILSSRSLNGSFTWEVMYKRNATRLRRRHLRIFSELKFIGLSTDLCLSLK